MFEKVNHISSTNTNDLVKKLIITHTKKITDHNHDKYITTQEFNKLISDNFADRLKQANLVSKNDIADFTKIKKFVNKLIGF